MGHNSNGLLVRAEKLHVAGDHLAAVELMSRFPEPEILSAYHILFTLKCRLHGEMGGSALPPFRRRPFADLRSQILFEPLPLGSLDNGFAGGLLSLAGLAQLVGGTVGACLFEQEIQPRAVTSAEARVAVAARFCDMAEKSETLDEAWQALDSLSDPTGPKSDGLTRWTVMQARALLLLDQVELASSLLEDACLEEPSVELMLPLAVLELRHASACQDVCRTLAAAARTEQQLANGFRSRLEDRAEAHRLLAQVFTNDGPLSPRSQRHGRAALALGRLAAQFASRGEQL